MTDKKTDNYSPMLRDDLIPVEKRIKTFTALLDTIESLTDKKKALWCEIYANAITDRNNANMCFNELFLAIQNNETKHAIHAPNIAKYIERMSQANNQLLKLAELIAEAETKEKEVDIEDVYEQIKNK
jgi:hypothetical protein